MKPSTVRIQSWTTLGAIVLSAWLAGGSASQAGVLRAWGDNDCRQCRVPEDTDFVDAAGGWEYTLGLRADGSLVGWGADWGGVSEAPPQGNDFVDVAAGYEHALALRQDGSLVAWGSNASHQCDAPQGK